MTGTCLATAAFGLEGVAAAELRQLGLRDVRAENGGARFTADETEIFRCNLRLRCADRVLMVLREEDGCQSFEALYQAVRQVPWEKLLPRDAMIHVSGKCVRSRLMSVRDCQSVGKRAILDRLREKTGQQFFPEKGAEFPIEVSVRENRLRITLDTSGEALNRRGYRTWNGEAPLRETLAAALVSLSPWRPGQRLYDPCCGTGTLLIEAAMRAQHMAPGVRRSFACERFPAFAKVPRDALRAEAAAEELAEDRVTGLIAGSDISAEALELAERHVRQAKLTGRIALSRQGLEQLQLEGGEGVFLCNPPYGERLGDRKSCERLYRELGLLQRRHPGWALAAISSDPMFERMFGRRADKKRRLYNGRLECEFLVFMPK